MNIHRESIVFTGECTTYVIRIATQARARALGPLHPTFNMVKYLRDGLEEFLPDDAHLTASGRLHVSLTRVCDRQNVIVTQFDTKEDLIQVGCSYSQIVVVLTRCLVLMLFIIGFKCH